MCYEQNDYVSRVCARALGELEKTIKYCFFKATCTKQGVGEASLRATINDYATALVAEPTMSQRIA